MQKLSYSLEDYVEEIYVQTLRQGCAKVTEIANSLGVKKASVTGALNALAEKKLINYVPYAPITLTTAGEEIAKRVLEKHELIAKFFQKTLNVSDKEAIEAACAMEHIISDDFFEKIKVFLGNNG